MIDHTGVPVSNMTRSKAWYAQALAPIGYGLMMEVDGEVPGEVTGHSAAAGFGEIITHKPDFWLADEDPARIKNMPRIHIAFTAKTRAAVDAFHAAAIAAGGKDNGPPGLRPHYHPNYYGAFVLDPDGHNIEAVCHAPA
jgi:catechol 2,3-dioxygenase-like lactoylglutathione lyase family enzyme